MSSASNFSSLSNALYSCFALNIVFICLPSASWCNSCSYNFLIFYHNKQGRVLFFLCKVLCLFYILIKMKSGVIKCFRINQSNWCRIQMKDLCIIFSTDRNIILNIYSYIKFCSGFQICILVKKTYKQKKHNCEVIQ